MYNISSFYQSTLRQYINEYIYNKPVIYIILGGQKYQCIIHDKKIGPINIYRAQILGICSEQVKSEYISAIKKELKSQVKGTCIYIQFGIADKLGEKLNSGIAEKLSKSIRENMPSGSTYIYTDQSIDDMYSHVSKSHKTHIKKAVSRGLTFDTGYQGDPACGPAGSLTFYQIWKDTAGTKGFGVPSQAKFESLVKYIYDNNCGKIFLTKLDGQIIGGAVCLFVELDGYKTCIYLYGATDRNAGNIGTNQFLHREIIKRCHENGYDIYDFLGISGQDDGDDHHLAGVTRFKLGFGGEVDYIIGGRDLVCNNLLYYIYNLTSK